MSVFESAAGSISKVVDVVPSAAHLKLLSGDCARMLRNDAFRRSLMFLELPPASEIDLGDF